ncbi:MAG: ammonia channel protein, partial [Pseudorhodobacter sp.]|nr:ammonia channel protein [Pseudorhodobacter sp.]
MKNKLKTTVLSAAMLAVAGAMPAFAQEVAAAVTDTAAAAAPIMDKGDVSWMMTSSALV